MPTATRKFTRAGFPKPDTRDEYKHDEIVWALVHQKYPYWPAQIKLDGGTVYCPKKRASTKGMKGKIPIVTFNDPELTVTELTEDDIINEKADSKPKKRKKDITKRRAIERSKLLKWDTKKKNGTEISYDDVVNEYLKRKGLQSVNDIDTSIWREWNENALSAAEEELKRLTELERLEKQRHLETQQLMEAQLNEINRAEAMKDQWYDGRLPDPQTGEKRKLDGCCTPAIRSDIWAQCQTIGNQQNLITTTITCIRDKYGTLRLKDTVPIDVEASGKSAVWNTEIEKLPLEDPQNPVYYPLSQCLFIPSQIEDKLETEHIKLRNEFNQELQKKGWGHMLYKLDIEEEDDENNDNSNNRNKNKNLNKKSKTNISINQENHNSNLSQVAPIVIDSDLEILEIQKGRNRSNKKRKRTAENHSNDVMMSDLNNHHNDGDPTAVAQDTKARRGRKRKKSLEANTTNISINNHSTHDITYYMNNGNNRGNQKRPQCVEEPPKRKKRRLNNTQISINEIMDENVIQKQSSLSSDDVVMSGNHCNNNRQCAQNESDSEDEPILDIIFKHDNSAECAQDSDCQIIQQLPSHCTANLQIPSSATKRRKCSRKRKNHANAANNSSNNNNNNNNNIDTSTESDSSMMVPTIPWPASPSEPQAATSPKRNRKKRKQLNNMNNADSDIGYHRDDDTDTDGVNRKVYSSLAELPCNNAPPPQPAKQPPQQRKSKTQSTSQPRQRCYQCQCTETETKLSLMRTPMQQW